jgi:hypothetical protein
MHSSRLANGTIIAHLEGLGGTRPADQQVCATASLRENNDDDKPTDEARR